MSNFKVLIVTISQGSSDLRFKVKDTGLFGRLFMAFAQRNGLNMQTLVLKNERTGRVLSIYDLDMIMSSVSQDGDKFVVI